eukprot:1816533-Amphidinium_carterae.2
MLKGLRKFPRVVGLVHCLAKFRPSLGLQHAHPYTSIMVNHCPQVAVHRDDYNATLNWVYVLDSGQSGGELWVDASDELKRVSAEGEAKLDNDQFISTEFGLDTSTGEALQLATLRSVGLDVPERRSMLRLASKATFGRVVRVGCALMHGALTVSLRSMLVNDIRSRSSPQGDLKLFRQRSGKCSSPASSTSSRARSAVCSPIKQGGRKGAKFKAVCFATAACGADSRPLLSHSSWLGSSFAEYHEECLSHCLHRREAGPERLQVFPCGLPFPEAVTPWQDVNTGLGALRSPRHRHRLRRRLVFKNFINLRVSYLNWLTQGKPRALGRGDPGPLASAVNARQALMCDNWLEDLRRFWPRRLATTASRGLSNFNAVVEQLEVEYSKKSFNSGFDTTVKLNAENMSLPGEAGQVPLEPPLLACFYRDLLIRPGGLVMPVSERPHVLPTIHMNVEDWPSVARQLRRCRLVRYVPEERVPIYQLASGRRSQARAGLFGVPKSSGTLARLI